jgi:O-antigen/teichoic acid export membrane protein
VPSTRVHKTSVRFGLTAFDQCVSSASNFAVGVAVARVAGISAFGAYSLVYAVWLLLAALHRSLITDPMAIENDMHQDEAPDHIGYGLAAELCLGLVSGILFAAAGLLLLALGQAKFGICFLGIAPWLPCLLAQDYWRWVGFMRSEPQKSLLNDIVFGVVQVAAFVGLYEVGLHSSLLAVEAWGIGAAAAALLGLKQFGARISLHRGFARVRQRWMLSKWLVSENLTSSARAQSTLLLTGAFLGSAGVGGLKAATSLVAGPSQVLIQAGGSIGLPEASKALKERGWPGLRRVARVVTLAGTLSVGLIAVVVLFFGQQLLVALYGPEFGQFWFIADMLAISFLVNTVNLGAILCLKATRNTRGFFRVAVGALIVSVVAMVVLAPLFGIVGAATATLIGSCSATIGLLITHWTSSRKVAERMYAAQFESTRASSPSIPPGFFTITKDRRDRSTISVPATTLGSRAAPLVVSQAQPVASTGSSRSESR